jgi:hypothetical protein
LPKDICLLLPQNARQFRGCPIGLERPIFLSRKMQFA